MPDVRFPTISVFSKRESARADFVLISVAMTPLALSSSLANNGRRNVSHFPLSGAFSCFQGRSTSSESPLVEQKKKKGEENISCSFQASKVKIIDDYKLHGVLKAKISINLHNFRCKTLKFKYLLDTQISYIESNSIF